jgi:metallo-beta-lactamase class B
MERALPACVVVLLLSFVAKVQAASLECSYCETWNREQAPFRIFGNTYYVGPHGLGSVLVTSPAGHVLIDGALPQSAPMIARHVRELGFQMSDVKVILSSHAHFDHVGGIAELQQLSGARVIASDAAVEPLRSGKANRSDPQFGELLPFPGVGKVEALGSRSSIRVGDLQLNVIHTPGHTPGGTSWHWQSCEAGHCLNILYADSLNAISDDAFKYGGDERYPSAAADMRASIAAIAAAPCDILISNHPERTGLWSVIDQQGKGDAGRLVDPASCKRYAEQARKNFDERLERERNGGR